MRSRAPSSAEEVWGEASLQGSCTVQALLCSDRSPLRNWTLSLAILAITSTHLKAQALRWAQGTSGEPAGTAGAAAAGGAAAVATPAVVPAPGAAAEAAEPGATTAEAEAVPKAAAAAGATPEAAAAEGEAAEAAPGAAAEAKAAAEVAAEAGGRQPCAKRQNNKDYGTEIGNLAPAPSPGPPAHKVLEILVESAEDVPLVEVCLRFAYMGAEALEESKGLPQLLAVYKQADYLGMSSCCKAVLEAAAQLKPEAMGIDDAVRAWGGIMPHNEQLRQLCTRALLHHLGDMLLVMRDEDLYACFLDLPLPAMLALLDSSDLATDSEDSVVAAVGCWVDHNEPTDGETKQLVDRLRLLQLSETYLLTVVPAMPWLLQHLPQPTFGRLMGAHLAAGRVGDKCSSKIYPRPRGEGSQAWFSTSQRKRSASAAGATSVLLDDHLTRQLIVDKLLPELQGADEATTYSPVMLIAHGYEINLNMELSKQSNAVIVYVCADTLQRTDMEGGEPAWRLQCCLSRQVPGGVCGKVPPPAWGTCAASAGAGTPMPSSSLPARV